MVVSCLFSDSNDNCILSQFQRRHPLLKITVYYYLIRAIHVVQRPFATLSLYIFFLIY